MLNASETPAKSKMPPPYKGWRASRYGPASTRSPPAGGVVYVVKERPSERYAHIARPTPSTASRIPSTFNGRPTQSGHGGGSNHAAAIAAISANCARTQRPPCARNSLQRDEPRVIEFRVDLRDELRRRGRVDREDHQRLPTLSRAGHRHVRDVDGRPAEERAHLADHPRDVVVPEDNKQRRELHVELEPQRAHEPETVVVAHGRARDPKRNAVGDCFDAHEVRVVAG